MSLGSYFLARAAGLPKARFRTTRTRDIRVPMRDGKTLETELFVPRNGVRSPTILMRVPYGLAGFATVADIYAERGYNVVIQACRGTDKSEGEFDPLTNEREDGLATLDWIKARSPGSMAASALSRPELSRLRPMGHLRRPAGNSAMAVKVTSAEFRSIVFPGGSFHLDAVARLDADRRGHPQQPAAHRQRMVSGGIERRTLRASMRLPLLTADKRISGKEIPFWRRWLANADQHDEFWEPLDHTHRIGTRTPPTSFVSGWYDFMLDQLLRDYETLVLSGHRPYLTVGPWFHVSNELQMGEHPRHAELDERELLGDRAGLRDKPVRIYVGGPATNGTSFDRLPARHARHPDLAPPSRQGAVAAPGEGLADPDTLSLRSRDPTPAVGGAMFAFVGAGPVDQAPLERRDDVLVYTSEPLFTASPSSAMSARHSMPAPASPMPIFFVRLCDVDEKGVSTNICDGIIRKTPADPAVPDDIWKLNFKLHATAHTFLRDHRLRLIVASGAHPRYARNTGTDEPLGRPRPRWSRSDIEIFHDPPQRPDEARSTCRCSRYQRRSRTKGGLPAVPRDRHAVNPPLSPIHPAMAGERRSGWPA